MPNIPIMKRIQPYLFISPFFISFLIFAVYPIIYGVGLSMTRVSGFSSQSFVGVANYLRVFSDGRFWTSIGNTFFIAFFGSILSIITLSILVAHLISNKTIASIKRPVTTILFFPNITSVIVVGVVFGLILKTDNGLINSFLGLFGIDPIPWLRDPAYAMPSLIILIVWRYLGINTLYVLAGLQNIPRTLYEAAMLEGAGKIKVFFSITLPLLKPMMEFIVFQALIGSFQIFGEPYILVGGAGVKDSMLFPTYYLYDTSVKNMKFGYAAAMAYVLTVIILLVTIIQRKVMKAGEVK